MASHNACDRYTEPSILTVRHMPFATGWCLTLSPVNAIDPRTADREVPGPTPVTSDAGLKRRAARLEDYIVSEPQLGGRTPARSGSAKGPTAPGSTNTIHLAAARAVGVTAEMDAVIRPRDGAPRRILQVDGSVEIIALDVAVEDARIAHFVLSWW